LPPTFQDQELTTQQIRELLQYGATSKPIALTAKASRKTWCLLALSPTGVVVEIPVPQGDEQETDRGTKRKSATRASSSRKSNSTKKVSGSKKSSSPKTEGDPPTADELGKCPLCASPVIESTKSYSCSRWRDGCGLTIWKTMSGKKITAAMVKRLLQKGETTKLKGFKSKAGKKFDAKLKLTGGKVEFIFE